MGLIGALIGLTLGVIVVTTVVVPTIKNANTTGWTSSEVTMLGLGVTGSLLGIGFAAFSAFGMV